MKWSKTRPKTVGHYWFQDGLTNNPRILRVTKEDGKLWAQDEEISCSFKPGSKITDPDDLEEWGSEPIPEPTE